jgi:hypothetical protein
MNGLDGNTWIFIFPVRNPIPAFSKNIPAGTKKVFDRIVDQPKEENRRFYPDKDLQPILVFDPSTGEQNIKVFPST